MLLPVGQRSTAWVKRLLDVVAALNNEVTRLMGKKPAAAIKDKAVSTKPSTPYSRPVGLNERNSPPKKHPSSVNVRYLNQPGEFEGGTKSSQIRPGEPVLYYLDGPKRGFDREELLNVPLKTQLPPAIARREEPLPLFFACTRDTSTSHSPCSGLCHCQADLR